MSTSSRTRLQRSAARRVSRPHDADEREAVRAADVVARGGSVAGWSFSTLPVSSAPVQRQEAAGAKPEEEKYKEAALKAGEAALATPQGQALKEKVLNDPLVKTVKDAVTSTPGVIATTAAAAGGVTALAATGKELPVQPPEIPLDKITPGLSAKVTYQGPVNAPTFVGLTITYKEQGPKGAGPKKTATEKQREENARLAAEQAAFRAGLRYTPGSKAAEEQRLSDEAIAYVVAQQAGRLPGLTIPLVVPTPKKEEQAAPVQPAPATAGRSVPAHARVDAALATPGRPLDPSTRRSMEARFGYDFAGVRIHDDPQAAAEAARIDAAAFTVGEDVVLGPGRADLTGDEGRRLLAHELTHVVQQTRPSERAPAPASSGRPLDARQRAYFEPRLGADFARVRIHAGAEAAAAAAERRARAYTTGDDVVFGKDQWNPDTPRGRWLLAHELAHVAQAGRGTGTGGTPAVEADASGAATAAVTGRPVRIGARRSGAEVHKFGEPDNTPDLTYVSTSGGQGFLREATAYHRTWGLSPTSFPSMQALLAALAQGSGTINRLRLVSHANYDNIFTPLFDGGSPGITEQDLLAWAESDVTGLRRVLQSPLADPATRSSTIESAGQANPTAFQALGIDPANPPTTGPVGQLLEASVDLALIQQATGTLPQSQRATFVRALTQELDGLRAQIVQQQPSGGTITAQQVQAVQSAITGLIVLTTMPAQHQQVMRGISAASAAVTAGFRSNLTAVRGRITSASWIDIRGCRVGQRQAYLDAVATFFGTGSAKPHVSGPDLWQSFPQLGWRTISERGLARASTEANVRTALDHWADVTGVRGRLAWWLRFLRRILTEEALQELQELQGQLNPPSLLGGLRLSVDPLLLDFTGELPPLPRLEEPELGAGAGFRAQAPSLGPRTRLQNPLAPVAQRDVARYGGDDGLFKYYLDAALPLPVQEGANVELMRLVFKAGLERQAIDAWTASEWGPAAPGLAAVQSGAWTRDDIRQVEAVVNLDSRRRATEMYISPDPRYAAHIKTT